ncbi:MAG: 4-hydroxybenzoate 3-monooxygenase [Azospirillaceae bacterium]|nr:4-hydroxybenzoate 3-monooxygenase [Azospirillaceae bacterium]
MTRIQVAIIGAGPAGLFLGHLLHRQGIAVTVLERRSRAHVEGRVRAGVLEQGTVDLLHALGLDQRLRHEGLVHEGTKLSIDGEIFHIDFRGLTGGATVTVYGQQELTRDLYDAAAAHGLPIVFEVEDVHLDDIESAHPTVSYRKDGTTRHLACDVIAGCDGFQGVSRKAIPAVAQKTFERAYDVGWLGILADVPPVDPELIYCRHADGFALASMRSPTRSRYYLQCAVDECVDAWPDDRFWDELCRRLGPQMADRVTRGPIFERSVVPLRSFVTEPMRHGRLFLAGDAAHIVPPTGAKGLNLAASDVMILARALVHFFKTGSESGLDGYSAQALARVWKAERFSWWFTGLTHRLPNMDAFARKMQSAELSYIRSSRAAQTTLAENYVGLPLDR